MQKHPYYCQRLSMWNHVSMIAWNTPCTLPFKVPSSIYFPSETSHFSNSFFSFLSSRSPSLCSGLVSWNPRIEANTHTPSLIKRQKKNGRLRNFHTWLFPHWRPPGLLQRGPLLLLHFHLFLRRHRPPSPSFSTWKSFHSPLPFFRSL